MNLGNIINSNSNSSDFLGNLKDNLDKIVLRHEQQKNNIKNESNAKNQQNDNEMKVNIETLKQTIEQQQSIQKKNEMLRLAAKGRPNASSATSTTIQNNVQEKV